jgi:hypothetical protein
MTEHGRHLKYEFAQSIKARKFAATKRDHARAVLFCSAVARQSQTDLLPNDALPPSKKQQAPD